MTADRPASLPAAPRRRRYGLTIQSKLLVMLLGVSLASSVIVGVIGFVNGRDSLRDDAFEQLTTIRELRTEEIEREFASIQNGVVLDSRNASAVEGATALVDAFADLQATPLEPDQDAVVEAFYEETFVPALEERSGLDYAPEAFVPASPAGRYLQYHYTAQRALDDFDAGLALTDAGDGSAWSAANAEYGPYFTGLVDALGYEDVLITDREGNVVYSAYKSVDLGVNLNEEPYASSTLATATNEVLRNGSLDEVVTTDFERYLPSLNVPTAWVASPIGSATEIVGVLAVQVPIDQINAVMTGNGRWAEQGLGETGEVYLAGSDLLMRSTSRLLAENPESYVDTVVANGTPRAVAERIAEVNGTVQLQPVDFPSTRAAVAGETGTALTADYTDSSSLVAYAPLDIDGLSWVIVAHMDADEAFAPVADFTRNIVISTLAILLAVSVLSLLLAQVFTRPVKKLVDAVRRVAGGDLAVAVPQGSRDEFGDLGAAFNDMAASLRVKQELIDEQRVENAKLLHTLMPETMAARYREGEETIAEEHENVSVVYAELIGFDAHAEKLNGQEEITELNLLMRGFDDAAVSCGVEKVRTLRGGYLASSGLIVPRVDNVRRAVDFARQMREVVARFNAQTGASIELRAGVDTGTVTSGLVARTSLAYDLWGDAVNLAHRVRSVTGEPGVYVSQSVRDRLADTVPFSEVGSVELHGVRQPVWRVG
ncbi:adenylate/guanylate cyclase domain-containing protein [Serinibacter arcticus]|uniref:Adenylate/guanylate cyclase domain-containing protein n=1 Tax=Serinibacter arcticus TaxID=1655435 RepID=A0A2U1ZVM3_9MICO|nr:adenylate/guanylate cyclase domain-containing protein [Serinibacter arcticus]PWD51028.1 adenylate/guanylate cyclase domain-containing protein [Serinibacter arcticus]